MLLKNFFAKSKRKGLYICKVQINYDENGTKKKYFDLSQYDI